MLVQFAIKWYYVPQQICDLLFRYYEDIFLRVATESWTSDYFHLAIGVPQLRLYCIDDCVRCALDIWRCRDISPGYALEGADICINRLGGSMTIGLVWTRRAISGEGTSLLPHSRSKELNAAWSLRGLWVPVNKVALDWLRRSRAPGDRSLSG